MGLHVTHGSSAIEERIDVKRRNLLVGVLAALPVTAVLTLAHAEDACRANCDQWVAACKRACVDAPVPDECRSNCAIADQQCLDDCAGN
jgi:hypothetical protein